MGVADSGGAPQGRLNACHRQDFLYKNLCVDDLPTPVQSAFSEDRTETTKCFDLGENQTEDSPFQVWFAIQDVRPSHETKRRPLSDPNPD